MTNTTTFLTAVKNDIQAFVLTKATYMAVGTDTTAASAADSALGTEVKRKAIEESTTGTSDVVVSLLLTSADANASSITEVGAFDASSAGNMMNRALYTAIAKTASIDVWIDIEEQIDVTQ